MDTERQSRNQKIFTRMTQRGEAATESNAKGNRRDAKHAEEKISSFEFRVFLRRKNRVFRGSQNMSFRGIHHEKHEKHENRREQDIDSLFV